MEDFRLPSTIPEFLEARLLVIRHGESANRCAAGQSEDKGDQWQYLVKGGKQILEIVGHVCNYMCIYITMYVYIYIYLCTSVYRYIYLR